MKQRIANVCWMMMFASTILCSMLFVVATTLHFMSQRNDFENLFIVSLIGLISLPGVFGIIAGELDD